MANGQLDGYGNPLDAGRVLDGFGQRIPTNGGPDDFARLADLLTQRVMRLADELELESPGTLLDRVRRAEKRGWVQQDGQLVRVRELRNLIAHEYEDEDLAALYREVIALAPVLLQAAQAAAAWAAAVR